MDTSDPVVFASVATAALVLFLFIWRIIFFFTADGTSFPLPVPLVLFIRCVFVFPTADGRKFERTLHKFVLQFPCISYRIPYRISPLDLPRISPASPPHPSPPPPPLIPPASRAPRGLRVTAADLTLLLKGPPPQEAFEDKVSLPPRDPPFPPFLLSPPPPSAPLPPLCPSPLCAPPPSAPLPLPGQELAQRFAAMGARLILSSRSAERLEAVRASCRGKHAPEGIVVLPFDLKGGADVLRGAVRQAESAFRGEGEGPCGVDVLVLNAAHPRPKLTCEDTPEDTLRGMLEVNVVATIELTRYLLPCMMQRNKGQILVVSSAAGKLPAPTQGVYAATKHALHGYFNTLRYEAVQHGVAVTLVCPGPIATEGSAEGAIKSASKPSADQAHAAAAGEDEKDSRMPASRCAELIVSAAAWRLEEAWISRHPVLLLMYLAQYFPATCSMLFRKIGPKRVQALKTGSSNMYSTSLLFTHTSSPSSSSSSSSLTSLSSSPVSISSTSSSSSRSPSPTHLPRAIKPHKSLSFSSLTHTPSHTSSHKPVQRSTTPSPHSSPPRSSSPLSSLSSPSLSPSSLSPALSPRRSPISVLPHPSSHQTLSATKPPLDLYN
ncbi:unnamed protein product [Closterium sp. Naga37s-1]|nr:unnamed protein product [Closterium sp. Naga37s-1]